jgi:hypothetical protein
MIDLQWRHDRLRRAVELSIRALRSGHSQAPENVLIILEVAHDEDNRTGEEACDTLV